MTLLNNNTYQATAYGRPSVVITRGWPERDGALPATAAEAAAALESEFWHKEVAAFIGPSSRSLPPLAPRTLHIRLPSKLVAKLLPHSPACNAWIHSFSLF
jgi:hypothetical protein